MVSLLFPQLAPFVQPLAGEYAGRREVLEQLPFIEGYGVDLGLLIDIEARFGLGAMAQVDLGQRIHRNRPLDQLSPQAMAVLQVALHRAAPDLVGTHRDPGATRPRSPGGRRHRTPGAGRGARVPPLGLTRVLALSWR